MPTASLALELQVWAVMESLAKAAVAEICTLVNSQCVEMRLEIRRGQTEIESLKGKLRDLRKALREKSTSTVSQINPQLGEDQRGLSADDLYQEPDYEDKEEDEKSSSPELMNEQEDSIQDGPNSHLNTADQKQCAVAVLPGEEGHLGNEWHLAPHCEEQIAAQLFINSQETHTDDHNPHLSCLPEENIHFINIEGEIVEHPMVIHQSTPTNPNSQINRIKRNVDYCELEDNDDDDDNKEEDDDDYADVDCLLEDGTKAKKKNIGKRSKRFDRNHSNPIDMKEENDDDISAALDEENAGLEMCYTMQSEESTIAPPISHIPTPVPGTSMVPNVPPGRIPQRTRVVKRVQGRGARCFICNHCGKAFEWMSCLDRHQLVHTGEKPYTCALCGRGFTQKIHLKKHMRKTCCRKSKQQTT